MDGGMETASVWSCLVTGKEVEVRVVVVASDLPISHFTPSDAL